MAPISTPSFQPGEISVQGATSVLMTNLEVINANTEYSLGLQSNLKQIIIKSREMAKLQFSFESGDSGSLYTTIWPGGVLTLSDLSFTGKSLYVQSNKAATVIEIVEFF